MFKSQKEIKLYLISIKITKIGHRLGTYCASKWENRRKFATLLKYIFILKTEGRPKKINNYHLTIVIFYLNMISVFSKIARFVTLHDFLKFGNTTKITHKTKIWTNLCPQRSKIRLHSPEIVIDPFSTLEDTNRPSLSFFIIFISNKPKFFYIKLFLKFWKM